MTKKEICMNNKSFAYYSGFGGVEAKEIEYGIDDYLYCVSNAWYGGQNGNRYHKLKIYTDLKGNMFVRLYGEKLSFDEFIRIM